MAGFSGLKVSPQQLSSLGGTCNRTATDVRGQHAALKGQLTPLFGVEWSGAAAAQFSELYAQFDSNAQGMTLALEGIGKLLGQAGQSYASVEQQIAASFRH
ncbi:MAG: WXG100 family type VII secretion target [Actinomycetota bacterium]|nr:WXG100 family type VII secretion target [Actinomycetota bacterium]MDQ2956827.1 WXG100 family type VII secretion target [Actinomycetota bacterium]